jgi:hypothetical protein
MYAHAIPQKTAMIRSRKIVTRILLTGGAFLTDENRDRMQ